MECPKCKGMNLTRKGKRAGKQRYKCRDCGAYFTEGVPYKESEDLPKLEMECPSCKSTEIVRDGKLEDGCQRYRCKKCGLNFSDKTPAPIKWKCPYCRGELAYSGYTKKGLREYKCTKCKKSCSADEKGKPIGNEGPFYLSNTKIRCPKCGTLRIKKGANVGENKRYICLDCGNSFTDRASISKYQLSELILNGAKIKDIVEKYTWTSPEINEIMKPYYKEETITSKQQQDIIKYGYHLNVPVEYLAEYIKCSEHKCREILKKYKKKLMSTSSRAI